MYNAVPSSLTEATQKEREEKMTVATLLSSLANGGVTVSNTQYTSSVMTPTTLTNGAITSASVGTPLLTPSTLASIEQVFAMHDQKEDKNVAVDLTQESGFVPPLVAKMPAANIPVMVKQECEEGEYPMNEDPEWLPPNAKRARISHAEDVHSAFQLPTVTPNSTVTASGSRRPTGPRAPRPNLKLSYEEEEKRNVRRERNKVAAAKCRQRRVDLTNRLLNETEGLEEEQATLEDDIQKLQSEKEQLEFLLEAHRPLCKISTATPVSSYTVKISNNAGQPAIKLEKPGSPHMRPSSLNIKAANSLPAVTSATGVPISTPSNGISVFNFGLEAMVDGHTGLTPITAAAPPSCSSEVQRPGNASITSSTTTIPSTTTLMAL